MNKLNIGDKVKVIKEESIFHCHRSYITNYFEDVCKFLVDFGSDDALFYPWELELIERKEDIDEKREKEKLYSALKTIKNYCSEHSCRICPLRLNDHGIIIECFLKNVEPLSPNHWYIENLKKFFNDGDKNENN